MAITPADIQAQTFSEAKRGYDPGEVDVFLEHVSAEVDAMLNKIVDLKNRLTSTEQQLAQAKDELAKAKAAPAPAQPESQQPAIPSELNATAAQISAALISAQQSADNIIAEARSNAERIRNEADAKAREVIRQALAEKQNELEEIDRLKASREEFKSEYLKLIQHFMDDAQNSFPKDLLASSTPTGSDAGSSDPLATVATAPVTAAPAPAPTAPASDGAAPAQAQDPFAPIDNFATDDLD